MLAMALLWTPHPRTTICNLLRNPDIASGWGQWVHAIDIRRNDAEPERRFCRAAKHPPSPAAQKAGVSSGWRNPRRMGQLRPVTVYRLALQGTVEEHIAGLRSDKRALAESIPGEGDAVNIPSTEALSSLIRGE